MNSPSKVALSLGAAAVACCAAYGGFLYFQGAQFDKIASDPARYLGEDFKTLKVQVQDRSIFSRKFSAYFDTDETREIVFEGAAKFGLNPDTVLKIKPFGNPQLQTLLKQADPTLTGAYNYRFLPKNFTLTANPFEISIPEDSAVLKSGASSGKVDLSFKALNDDKYEIQNLRMDFSAAGLSVRMNNVNVFSADRLDAQMIGKGAGSKNITVSTSAKNLFYNEDLRNGFSLNSGELAFQLTEHGKELLQKSELNLTDLNVRTSGVKTRIQSADIKTDLHFPNDPELFAAAATAMLGEDTCRDLPALCGNAAPNLDSAAEKFIQAVRSGSAWLQIQPSTVKTKKDALDFSGIFRNLPNEPVLANGDVKFVSSSDEVKMLINMFLPRQIYTRPDTNTYISKITAEKEGSKILLKGNGKMFFSLPNLFQN